MVLVVLKLRRGRELSVAELAEVPALRALFTNQARVLEHVLHQPEDRWRQVETQVNAGGDTGEDR